MMRSGTDLARKWWWRRPRCLQKVLAHWSFVLKLHESKEVAIPLLFCWFIGCGAGNSDAFRFLANDEKWERFGKEVEVEADQVPPGRFGPLVVRSEAA
jgi:hypothetical protein